MRMFYPSRTIMLNSLPRYRGDRMTKPGLQHSFIQQTPLSTAGIKLQDLVKIYSVISACRDKRCESCRNKNLPGPACHEDSVVNVDPTDA